MAQGTKVNMCEFFITKVDVLSFVTQKYRTLVPAIGLMYILQLGTLDESVFFFFCAKTLPFSLPQEGKPCTRMAPHSGSKCAL